MAAAPPHGALERDHGTLDSAITRALQPDGRASISELAADVGASRDLVSQRLRVLLERGGLRVVAALDPGVAGHHVLVHTMIAVDGRALPVAQQVAEMPDSVFVSLTSGALPDVDESRHGSVDELHASLDAVRKLADDAHDGGIAGIGGGQGRRGVEKARSRDDDACAGPAR